MGADSASAIDAMGAIVHRLLSMVDTATESAVGTLGGLFGCSGTSDDHSGIMREGAARAAARLGTCLWGGQLDGAPSASSARAGMVTFSWAGEQLRRGLRLAPPRADAPSWGSRALALVPFFGGGSSLGGGGVHLDGALNWGLHLDGVPKIQWLMLWEFGVDGILIAMATLQVSLCLYAIVASHFGRPVEPLGLFSRLALYLQPPLPEDLADLITCLATLPPCAYAGRLLLAWGRIVPLDEAPLRLGSQELSGVALHALIGLCMAGILTGAHDLCLVLVEDYEGFRWQEP